MKRCVCVFLVLLLTFIGANTAWCEETASAGETEEESAATDASSDAETNVEAEKDGEELFNALKSVLDPDDNSLQKKAESILNKYSDNPIVKFFKKIIDAIASFIDAVFELASEAVKIEVT